MVDRCPALGFDFINRLAGQCAHPIHHRGDHEFMHPTSLDRLEAKVEAGCQAIYRECEGYWPSDYERHRIAIAIVEAHGVPTHIGRSAR